MELRNDRSGRKERYLHALHSLFIDTPLFYDHMTRRLRLVDYIAAFN